MRTISLNTTLRLAIVAVAVVAAPAMIFAQGETFTDCDAWTAAICGNIVDDDTESLVDFEGNQIPATEPFGDIIPSPQSLVWGELSQAGTQGGISFFAGQEANGGICSGFIFDDANDDINEGRAIVFTPDIDALGPLEGVCFDYFVDTPGAIIVFNAFDGDTLVASIPLPATDLDDDGNFVSSVFGWQNTAGLNVTRFEFAVDGGDLIGLPAGFVGDGQLAFGDGCDPPEATCFEQLGDVEANLAALVDTLSGDDAYFAACALDCVRWMQHDCFWEQPSGNRLSRYGGSLFVGAAYTILYLEWVDDPQADVLIDDLIGVLECIVDNEIAYAIANGGSQSFIDRAEDFAELGEIIDDDFENEVVASLAYRLAWIHAYYSTQ